ncbi:hypothetical protein ABPG72_018882 [Tetrahymena utriculariae]
MKPIKNKSKTIQQYYSNEEEDLQEKKNQTKLKKPIFTDVSSSQRSESQSENASDSESYSESNSETDYSESESDQNSDIEQDSDNHREYNSVSESNNGYRSEYHQIEKRENEEVLSPQKISSIMVKQRKEIEGLPKRE